MKVGSQNRRRAQKTYRQRYFVFWIVISQDESSLQAGNAARLAKPCIYYSPLLHLLKSVKTESPTENTLSILHLFCLALKSSDSNKVEILVDAVDYFIKTTLRDPCSTRLSFFLPRNLRLHTLTRPTGS